MDRKEVRRYQTWRDRARPLVQSIWEEVKACPSGDQRRAFRKGYPWGEKRRWPYKVWRSEVRLCLGLIVQKRTVAWVMRKREAEGQMRLFEEE